MKKQDWVANLDQTLGVMAGYWLLDQEWSSIIAAGIIWFLIGIPVRFTVNKIVEAIGL